MEWVRLGDITEILDNRRVPLNNEERSKISNLKLYPYCGANGIIDYIDEFIFDEDEEIICVAEDGGAWGYLQKCSYIMKEKCWVNNHAHVLKAKSNFNSKFLNYYLNYKDLSNHITGTTRGKLTQKEVKNILIPNFKLEKQNIIVNFLSRIETLIRNRKEQILSYDDLIESLLKNILNNPNNNKVDLEKFLEDITAGKSLAGKEKSNFKVLKTSCVFTGHFDENEWKYLPKDYIPQEKHIIKEGDILVSRMNTSELVGASVYVYKDYEDLTVPDRLWILKLKNNISRIYLWKFFQTNFYRNQIQNISTGTSGSMKNISQKNFRKLEIIYPPIELQNKFAEYVIKIEEEKKKLNSSLKELEDLFDALMQDAFSGNLFKD